MRCERFYNWIFINEDPQAQPLLEHTHPFFDYFRQFDPDCWRFVVKEEFDVACNVKVLLDAGYAVEELSAFDMFPQTHHLEAVVWLRVPPRQRPLLA